MTIFRKTIFSFLTLSLLFIACEDGDQVFDQIIADVERGAVLRTVNVVSDELPIGVADGFFAVDLEVQDQGNGTLVDAIEVYTSFRDNTPDNGKGATTDENLAETISKSEFTIGEFGLPRLSYEITLSALLAATGVPESDIDGSDQFRVRFELVLNDGRRYSFADNTGTLTGSFFSSPFLYSATIVCPPKPPTPGVWTINMTDSYGDGWQTSTGGGGDGIQVTLDDGTVLEVGLCSPYGSGASTFLGSADCTPNDGSSGSGTITIPAGTLTADWFFPGDFYGEIDFEIVTPNGNIVGGYPGTDAGPITIDFCKD
ncbi:MAG: hypothetical protein HKP24_01945 [Croceitalea sp.]|nr:hypothetical protein [Croceitalea sp.]NNM17309.1 hypothetical protein [Croceitalea sp.]